MNFNNDVDMDVNLAVTLLYESYPQVARSTLEYLIEDGVLHYGLSAKACYDGLRMVLAEQYGRPETFTVADVSGMLGISESEVIEAVKELEAETSVSPQA